MLKEIICDKIPEGRIAFNEGLNVVVGDEAAANSIGKSSALAMIDFAFGGDFYAKREDIIKNVGHHELKMHFVFNGNDCFFSRGTADSGYVHICNSDYDIKGTMGIADYKHFLSERYLLHTTSLKIGEIVSQFCRIYGKDNYNEHEPLKPDYKAKVEQRIIFLVKLFGHYNAIEEQAVVMNEAADRKSAYNKVVNLKLVAPVKNKTEYKKILKDISRLEGEVDVIKAQLSSQAMTLTSEQLKQISVLKTRLSHIQNEKALVQSTIKRLHDNLLSASAEMEVNLSQIREFFPAVEIKKIDEINQFHIKLGSILQEEIEKHVALQEKKLSYFSEQESKTVEQIRAVATNNNPADLAIDRLVATKYDIDKLIQGKSSYELVQQLAFDYKQSREMYDKILDDVLNRIMFEINKEMESLNNTILGEGKKSPLIKITPTRYSIKSEDDTGTGTNYRVLITFDLAVLNLTSLPVLIHDSLLFKNVEDDSLDGILSLYEQKTDKQVFISIDKVGSYGEQVQSIVERHKVLQLSEEHPLYGKSWKV